MQHMIGLVCLEQVLAEAGWTVANLGADLPSTDLGGSSLATRSPWSR
jgi:methanogenic corrinoid protein MtbC1